MNKEITNKYLRDMISKIDSYQDGKISLRDMHVSVESLYALIENSDKSDELSNSFHKYWDYIEEIIAINEIDEYMDKIQKDILPNFKIAISKFLS
jgi:Ca2+-binding EF-hand superfamily protein